MKLKWWALWLFVLLLTGCIDIFHAVSLKKGRVEMTLRYTLQKGALEMMGGFSGEELDFSELTQMEEELFGDFRGTLSPIDTPYYVGTEIHLKGKLETLLAQQSDAGFLPLQTEEGYEIAIPSLWDESVDEGAMAFIAGAKYTLLVDLRGDLKGLSQAAVKGAGAGNGEIFVNVYGSSLLVEIPMALLFSSKENLVIELR